MSIIIVGAETIAARQQGLLAAHQAHPERFVRGTPRPQALPTAVWINPPSVPEPEVEPLSVLRAQLHSKYGWNGRQNQCRAST
jgi:hypothetical protein